jgi:RNA polymerase sigma-70 factor (ECF subfamily)
MTVTPEFEDFTRLFEGDKATWDRFVQRFSPVIFAAVRRRLVPAGRTDDAEDVAQDVFMKLCARDYRVLRTYDAGRAKLTTWLTVISNTTAIDHLRRQKGPTQDIDAVPESRLSVDPKEPAWLKIPPGLLSPRQALVLEMLYTREMEVAEVAGTLGVDPQTVRSTHHKALIKLRAHFKE